MKPYYERDGIRVYHGDCREVMAGMEEGCVDTVITDPPYGLSFMGKDWDHGVPGRVFWEAVLRVAKPGAMLLAFGGTRTHHRLMCAIEDAGWQIRDVIMWVYGSGFPKSLDIGKAIDRAAGAEREVIAKHPQPSSNDGNDVAMRAMPSGKGNGCFITAPATEAAAEWDGWGTALKPAWEPIVVAMKAVDGTFAQNALEHGVAGLWVDGGRVSANGETWEREPGNIQPNDSIGTFKTEIRSMIQNPLGRWPANLIHDGSDEVVGLFPNSDGQNGAVGPQYGKKLSVNAFGDYGPRQDFAPRGDSGSAARFFYCAKASREERNRGLEGMETRDVHRFSAGIGEGKDPDALVREGNYHPTVKPLALMEYLCRLTRMPTGGVILDPFAGSGTTLAAAHREGRRAIGIEIDEGYCEIAAGRIPRQRVLGI